MGTVHGDPEGYQLAWQLLTTLRPSIVAVEISRFSLRYRQQHERRWNRQLQAALSRCPPGSRQHLAVQRLAAQISLPFEARVARDYAVRHRIPWHPVDVGCLSRQHLPLYARELLTPGNVTALLATPDSDWHLAIDQEYQQAAALLHGSVPLPWVLRQEFLAPSAARREKVLARRLAALARQGSTLVYLGGWHHLLLDSEVPNLASLLEFFQPARRLLRSPRRLPVVENY